MQLHVVLPAATSVIKPVIPKLVHILYQVVTNMPGISQMNKAQLVAEIQHLGGTADLSARKLELQQQLYDLSANEGVTSGNRMTTDYQAYTRAMNKAGKYKKDLIAYMQEHLNLAVSTNATQIQLQKQALLKIYELSSIDETDPVGFGVHGSLTYREVLETQPAYCQWAQTTAPRGAVQPPDDSTGPTVGPGEREGLIQHASGEGQSQDQEHRRARATYGTGGGYDKPELTQKLFGPGAGDDGDDGGLEGPTSGSSSAQGGAPQLTTPSREPRRPGDGGGSQHGDRRQLCGCEDTGQEQVNGSENESQIYQLDDRTAQHLETQAGALVPSTFQQLVGEARPLLMEVCCDSDSALTSAVQEAAGCEQAATRCSLFNACDLGTDAGVRLVLERIQVQAPQLVWMKPPAAAYSPLSQLQGPSRQPQGEQQEALQQRRLEARRLFVGCACVLHHCLQQGIHVVLELPEKSLAWRMPLFASVKQKYGLSEVTTSGCAMNLRDKHGSFVKSGLRFLTTHRRLARALDIPCRCPRNYVHGRQEHAKRDSEREYTHEFIKRVVKHIGHELESGECEKEIAGSTQLPEGFGDGACCNCAELHWPNVRTQVCASCLLGRSHVVGHNPESPEQGVTPRFEDQQTTQEQCQVALGPIDPESEAMARTLLESKDFSYPACETLVQGLKLKNTNKNRNLVGTEAETVTLGMYACGNHYGVTKRTLQMPWVTKYLNSFLQQKCPQVQSWSSLVISRNLHVPLHRDLHNLPGSKNVVVGLGTFTKGEIWIEGGQPEQPETTLAQVRHDGVAVPGHKWKIRRRPVVFDPKAWHGSCAWEGERMILAAYSSRGLKQASSQDEHVLVTSGFPIHKSEQAHAVSERREQREREKQKKDEQIRKQLYLLHAATGHGSTRHLIQALRRRNASPRVLELAKEFKCSVCQERPRVQPRHLASLEPLPPKWHTIIADIGHFHHPETGEHAQFMVIIDEGSRFRTARILTKGSKQQPTSAACLQYLREGWTQYFGNPRCLRLDPGGSFRSQAVQDYCDRNEIFLDIHSRRGSLANRGVRAGGTGSKGSHA